MKQRAPRVGVFMPLSQRRMDIYCLKVDGGIDREP